VDDVEQRLIVVDEEEERKGAEFEETKDEVITVVDNLRRRFSSRSTGIFRRCL
jgi:glucose-6-phosphate isomerase